MLKYKGNCPKYITVRELEPFPRQATVVAHADVQAKIPGDHLILPDHISLPEEVRKFISTVDTTFLASKHLATIEDESYAAVNIRGGQPGFVRVSADGSKLYLPDFSGNRYVFNILIIY